MNINLSTRELLAYAAGIIDGEGHIGLHVYKKRNQYTPTVTVAMTELKALNIIHLLFGGSLSFHEGRKAKYKGVGLWQLSSREDIIYCLTKLSPFLQVKKDLSDLMLNYFADIKHREVNPAAREQYLQQFKVINGGKVA